MTYQSPIRRECCAMCAYRKSGTDAYRGAHTTHTHTHTHTHTQTHTAPNNTQHKRTWVTDAMYQASLDDDDDVQLPNRIEETKHSRNCVTNIKKMQRLTILYTLLCTVHTHTHTNTHTHTCVMIPESSKAGRGECRLSAQTMRDEGSNHASAVHSVEGIQIRKPKTAPNHVTV